jgi:hypothetical protein
MQCPVCKKNHRKKDTARQCRSEAGWAVGHEIVGGRKATKEEHEVYDQFKQYWEKLL